MFCDLVGSTALATQFDPEELHEAIGAYQRRVGEVAGRRGGFIARLFGDGALVCFGYPQAREQDAELAVRAGLEIVDAVSSLALVQGYKPQVRIGIATGLCVVSAGGEGGSPPELSFTGEAPNLAARLQAMAEPNSVVISQSTRRLAGGLFVYRDLGAVELKGFAEPVPVWQVVAESGTQSRFEARREARAALQVDRERELERMLRYWKEVRAGRGQVVVVQGEPGIGKSHLVAMLERNIDAESHGVMRYFCSPDGQSTPFYPYIRLIEHLAGFAQNDDARGKLEKLIASMTAIGLAADQVAAIGDLLSLPVDGRLPKLELDPRLRRAKGMEALLAMVDLEATRRPLLVIWEDVHWIDPTSRELLDPLIEQVTGLPVLLVLTSRSEIEADWIDDPHVSTLMLPALGRSHSMTLIERVAGGSLADNLVDNILERSDGVPLYLEELTAAVLEGRQRGEAGTSVLARPSSRGSAVPDTLHASLMARLDRLGAAKEVAHIGAAIGREFASDLVAAVVQGSSIGVSAALQQLMDAGLVSRQPAQDTLLFKHALIRDAAYGTMTRDTRRSLHRRIAEALERSVRDTAASRPEVLAHHYTEAGLTEKAIDYWLAAGHAALKKSALAEAIVRLRKGLDLIHALQESAWRDQRELDLLIGLGNALMATKGALAVDTVESFARARALCKRLNRPRQLVSVLHSQWLQAFMRNDLASAQRRAAEVLEAGEKDGDIYRRWAGHRLLGTTSFPMGEFMAGQHHFQQSLELHDAALAYCRDLTDDDARAAKLTSFNEAHVVELAYSSWTLLYLGHLDQARRRRDEALYHARRGTDAYTTAHATNGGVFIEMMLNSPRTALERLRELETLTGDHEITYYSAMGRVFGGWCLAALGEEEEGIARIKSGIAAYKATGTVLYLPSFFKLLADACRMAQRWHEALEALSEADAIAAAGRAHQDDAEIQRVRGELLAVSGDAAAAKASLLEALAAAERQGARLLELRAAISLARLSQERGQSDMARERLSRICGWYTEGQDTPVLVEARTLLRAAM